MSLPSTLWPLALGATLACTPLVGSAPVLDAAVDATPTFDAALDGDACPRATATPWRVDPTLSGTSFRDIARFSLKGAARDGVGRIYAYGYALDYARAGSSHDAIVARFDAEGRIDVTFAERGVRSVDRNDAGETSDSFLGMDIDPRGRLVLVGVSTPVRALRQRGLVVRLTEDGAFDATFGDGGVRTLALANAPGARTSFYAVLAGADGIVLAGADVDPFAVPSVGIVLRVRDDGELDPDFHGGTAWIQPTTGGFSALARVPRGYAVAGNSRGLQARVALLGVDGQPVAGFGVDGVATHTLSGGIRVRGLVVDGAGGLVVAGSSSGAASGAPDLTLTLERFAPDGTPDLSFGTRGVFEGLARFDATYQFQPSLVGLCDGRLLVVGGDHDVGAVAMVTPQGRSDLSFGSAGELRTSLGPPKAALVDPRDGRVTLVIESPAEEVGASVISFARYLP